MFYYGQIRLILVFWNLRSRESWEWFKQGTLIKRQDRIWKKYYNSKSKKKKVSSVKKWPFLPRWLQGFIIANDRYLKLLLYCRISIQLDVFYQITWLSRLICMYFSSCLSQYCFCQEKKITLGIKFWMLYAAVSFFLS